MPTDPIPSADPTDLIPPALPAEELGALAGRADASPWAPRLVGQALERDLPGASPEDAVAYAKAYGLAYLERARELRALARP